MTTPEGRIKAKVNKVLQDPNIAPYLWMFMPVPSGYQKATLDYLCVVCPVNIYKTMPVFFAIETKKPGDVPTFRQQDLINDLRDRMNARVFVIDDDTGVARLRKWLETLLIQTPSLENTTGD